MQLIVTGHREEKLTNYNTDWIYSTLSSVVYTVKIDYGISIAYSGMASGVDLEFCKACFVHHIPFIACVPFEGQELYMNEATQKERKMLLSLAKETKYVKNSWMVEHADFGIVVWDGNKGGTHNVVQQLIEKNVPFYWINPVGEKIWLCN